MAYDKQLSLLDLVSVFKYRKTYWVFKGPLSPHHTASPKPPNSPLPPAPLDNGRNIERT